MAIPPRVHSTPYTNGVNGEKLTPPYVPSGNAKLCSHSTKQFGSVIYFFSRGDVGGGEILKKKKLHT